MTGAVGTGAFGAGTVEASAAAREALDTALLAAHAAGDGAALVGLYREAAERDGGTAAAFYLTHAYVYALEAGDARAAALHARLKAMGRDA